MFTTRGEARARSDTVPDFPFAVGCIRSATCMTRRCGSLVDPRYPRWRPSPASRELIPGVALAFQVAAHSEDIMAAYRHAAKALVSALAVAAVPACRRDCCGPDRVLTLFVGVRVDSAAFRSRGEFALELVPADQTGQTLVTDAWTISGTLVRSEEHTSELQSPCNLVCRLL